MNIGLYQFLLPEKAEHLDCFKFTLPKGANILTFKNQANLPYIWAIVDTDAEPETRIFRLAKTGDSFEKDVNNNGLHYIGSDLFCGGTLDLHLFEVIRKD